MAKIVSKEMCYYCFDSLLNHLNPNITVRTPTFPNEPLPLFVTWKKHVDGQNEDRLRGCIGSFEPLRLHSGLKKYAIISACQDRRFNPVELDEVKDLNVSISLLTNFEDAEDYLDWTVGLHGIIINFRTDHGTLYNATFLPEVASENEWSKVETIDQLIRKSGYESSITDQFRRSIRVMRYQSQKEKSTYQEYISNKH